MSIYQYRAGIGNAASYQASGSPFITGSTSLTGIMKIEFPRVTKSITIHELNNNSAVYFYFHSDAPALNKFCIDNSSQNHGPVTIDVKCKEIYISGSGIDFCLYASLTGIEAKEMFELTGSGITE
jgi:hypothetical protein